MKKSIEFNGRRFTCEYAHPKVKLNPLEFMYITRVIKGSPAKKLGVKSGDALLKLNGKSASKVALSDLYLNNEPIEYVIYREDGSKGMHIKGPNLPLGFEVEYTSEKLIELFDKVDGEEDQLEQLWQRGDWHGLLAASKDITIESMPILKWLLNLVGRGYVGPGILMRGIALYELGEIERAKVIINTYYDQYLETGTINFHALCFYYLGLIEREQGNSQQAFNCWHQSEYYCHCVVLRKNLQQLGIMPTIKSPWQHRQFPINFHLQNLKETRQFRLSDILAQLADKQLLFIAGLPGFRTNDPLDKYMLEYEKLVSFFPDYCGSFLVITEKKDDTDLPKEWFDVEHRLIDKGLPIEFLFDEGRHVVDMLDQNGSPNIYVLNKQGMVINRPGGDFKATDIWGCFAYEFGDVFVDYDCDDSE